MIGSSGSHQVIGILTQQVCDLSIYLSIYQSNSPQREGQYALEDMGASVPVDFSQATVLGGLMTETCVLLAEGEMRHGT